ncbi:cysteine desulfurase/sulfurtransferase TusA family protein, partial [Streptomyces sp. SID11385]|uniref:cysteine desulfurase/sulfurtransferase TusA family protein n=1 Tax=Streptomyces sp. SID11385 TaxID=2706031 RepID=UPI0013CADD20
RAEAVARAGELRALTARLRERVPLLVPRTEVVGDPERRLPHLLTFSCLYVDGESVLGALDRAGFSVSSGSSCTSSALTPSHVLRAMGVLSEGNVRVSLPLDVRAEDVDRFLEVLPGVVAGVREQLGAPRDEEPPAVPSPGSPAVPSPGPLVVDALGKRCPIPVIELAKVFPRVPVGATVTVLSDDEAAALDIPAWCEMRGQEYVGREGTAYRVRRTG